MILGVARCGPPGWRATSAFPVPTVATGEAAAAAVVARRAVAAADAVEGAAAVEASPEIVRFAGQSHVGHIGQSAVGSVLHGVMSFAVVAGPVQPGECVRKLA